MNILFNTTKDIELDIKSKISKYLKDDTNISINMLSSVVWNYLHELKNIHEIESFQVSEIYKENNSFNISFYKNCELCEFNISMIIEIRNIKIEKIKSNKVIYYKIK